MTKTKKTNISDVVVVPKVLEEATIFEKPKEKQKQAKPKNQTNSKNITQKSSNTINKGVVTKNYSRPRNIHHRQKKAKTIPFKIIPLGGLNEIGKNLTCFECENDIIIVDCGLAFPDADMLGVDLVIPDFSYLENNFDRIKGVVLTHGHEDHIGGLPYLLKKINVPIYGTRLTLGLVEGKLKEHGILSSSKLITVLPKQTITLGCMKVEFISVNHSIPDAVGLAVHSPAGIVVHTGDFKIDYTPIQGDIIDLARFSELGSKGVLCLLADSTNAERSGSSLSERNVGASLGALFNSAVDKRIVIATFASNIHRVQQIIDNAQQYDRKVTISGRSMVNYVNKAMELGYLKMPEGILVDIEKISKYPNEKIVLITTGSQGEPMSALSRMSSGDHRQLSITSDDFIIISATPIPGNEKHITRVINELMRLGAEVIYEAMYEVHVSGHACQDELKLMLSLVKPKYFIPVHGEYKHLKKHSGIAKSLGYSSSNIHIGDVGQVIELDEKSIKVTGTVPSGAILVDKFGTGDVGSIVLRDRKILSEDGLIIVVATIDSRTGRLLAGPDIVSRGFVYVRQSEELMQELRENAQKTLDQCQNFNIREWGAIKINIRDGLSNYIYKKTKRSPMILPILMEV